MASGVPEFKSRWSDSKVCILKTFIYYLYTPLQCIISLSSNSLSIIIIFSFFLFIYLLLAALGLHCCTWAFFSCSEQGLFSSFGAQAFHCGGFSCCGAQALGTRASVVVGMCIPEPSCGAWAWLPHGMWNLPGPGN